MADQKITELVELTTPQAADLLAIVDIDAPGGAQTKKVSFANFVGGGDLLPTADITNDIGSETLRWKDILAQRVVAVGGDLAGNFVESNVPAAGSTTSVFGTIDHTAGTAEIRTDSSYGSPGLIVGNVVSQNATSSSIMEASVSGAITFGTVRHYSSNPGASATINNNSRGSITGGVAQTYYTFGGTAIINNRQALSCIGYVIAHRGNTATLETGPSCWGTQASGAVFAYGHDATIRAYGAGQMVSGYLWAVYGGGGLGGDLTMEAKANCKGAVVFGGGTSYNAGTGATGFIGNETPGTDGSFTQGWFYVGPGTGSCIIQTDGRGSFAQGYARSYNSALSGTIEATAHGSFAQGSAQEGTISSSALGSFAHGHATAGNSITADADGAFATGNALTADITASAINAQQFGQGVNALADSLQVGAAGIRFKGTSGAPGTPQNGDFWIAGSDVVIRSGGVSVVIA